MLKVSNVSKKVHKCTIGCSQMVPFCSDVIFSFDEHYQQGFDVYRSNFSHFKPGQLTLDASTGYTRYPQYPNSAQRLHEASPDARLIYLMRHPVDRAYSHYIHRFTKECFQGQPIDRSFEEYVVTDPMCVDSSNYR